MSRQIEFVQGNVACAKAALYAGLEFFAGYPITPSSEIAEFMARRLPQNGGKFLQMEDEIASLCAIIGASITGRKVMTATSGPGFSLMQEALGYAVMTEIPCVIVKAFNFAETYRTPVIMLLDEVTGHMRERLDIPQEGEIPRVGRLKTTVEEGVDYHPYLPRED